MRAKHALYKLFKLFHNTCTTFLKPDSNQIFHVYNQSNDLFYPLTKVNLCLNLNIFKILDFIKDVGLGLKFFLQKFNNSTK